MKRAATTLKTTLLLSIIGVSFLACNAFNGGKPRDDLANVRLNEDIVLFSFKTLPKIYSSLSNLNNEILLIDKEITRLKQIESKFPRQQKIVAAETADWKKIRKKLAKNLESLEKDIEKIYVTCQVNGEKGDALIEKKTDAIVSAVDETLKTTTPHTRRLRPKAKKNIVAKIKAKFSS